MKYSLVGPLFAAPLYLLGSALGYPERVTALFNLLLLFGLAGALWSELKAELSPAARRTLLTLLGFASMFTHHVQWFYGEVFSTVTSCVGLLWLSRGLAWRGWLLITLGAANTPASLLGVGAIALSHARLTRSWLPLGAPLLALALSRLESLLVRGSLLTTGYADDHGFQTELPYSGLAGFSYPLFFGVLSLVFSFGKGLIFFTPGLFLGVPPDCPARLRWVHHTLVAYVIGLIAAYARWWSWYGGWFWGPRFLLAASVPASIALALNISQVDRASVRRMVATTAALVLSFWVGVNGLAFQNVGLGLCKQNNYALEAFCHYVPELSPLWHPFVDGGAGRPTQVLAAAYAATAAWSVVALWVGRHALARCARLTRSALTAWRTWW
jgi:hypothetical protein